MPPCPIALVGLRKEFANAMIDGSSPNESPMGKEDPNQKAGE